jgi:hypothetical protein
LSIERAQTRCEGPKALARPGSAARRASPSKGARDDEPAAIGELDHLRPQRPTGVGHALIAFERLVARTGIGSRATMTPMHGAPIRMGLMHGCREDIISADIGGDRRYRLAAEKNLMLSGHHTSHRDFRPVHRQ